MVRAMSNGVELKMSKRSGKAITLRDLMDEVGTDALRYMYISKSLDTHTKDSFAAGSCLFYD